MSLKRLQELAAPNDGIKKGIRQRIKSKNQALRTLVAEKKTATDKDSRRNLQKRIIDGRMDVLEMRKELLAAVQAETAASEWWDSLSLSEKKAYIRAHPTSKFAMRLAGTSRVARQKLHELSDAAKSHIDTWNNRTTGEKVASTGKAVVHAGKQFGHHTVHHLKHEAHMYKAAGGAVKHLMTGHSWHDLSDDHKKSLRNALIHAGLTAGSMMLGDPSGSAHHGIAGVLSEFAHHHAHHALTLGAGEVGLKTGKDAVKHALTANAETAGVDPRKRSQLAEQIAKALAEAKIPASEWVHILHEIEQQLRAKKVRK